MGHNLINEPKAWKTDVEGGKNVQKLWTSATGTFTTSGLKTGFLITTMDVADVAIKLPSTPLTNRNAILITNLDEADTLYIGGPSVVASRANGSTAGWEVSANETFNLDITDAIELYGRVESGKTIKIKIFEVA